MFFADGPVKIGKLCCLYTQSTFEAVTDGSVQFIKRDGQDFFLEINTSKATFVPNFSNFMRIDQFCYRNRFFQNISDRFGIQDHQISCIKLHWPVGHRLHTFALGPQFCLFCYFQLFLQSHVLSNHSFMALYKCCRHLPRSHPWKMHCCDNKNMSWMQKVHFVVECFLAN